MNLFLAWVAGGVITFVGMVVYLARRRENWGICVHCHAHYLVQLSDSQMPDLFCTGYCEGKELAQMDKAEVWRRNAA